MDVGQGSSGGSWIAEMLFGSKASQLPGKFTVMNHLVTNQETAKLLAGWTIVGLFLSDRGIQVGKCWIGMLQSMLYYLISQIPDLLPTVVKFCSPPRDPISFPTSMIEPIRDPEF